VQAESHILVLRKCALQSQPASQRSQEMWAPDASDNDARVPSNPSGRGSFGFSVPDRCTSRSYDAASMQMVGQRALAIDYLPLAQHEGVRRVDDYPTFQASEALGKYAQAE
jgi:hypothetical protein